MAFLFVAQKPIITVIIYAIAYCACYNFYAMQYPLKKIIISLLVSYSNMVSGQTEIDQLWDSISSFSSDDEIYLKLSLKIADEYTRIDPDTSIYIIDQLFHKIQGKQDRFRGKAYLIYGIANSFKGNYDISTEYLFKSIQEAEKYKDGELIIDGFNNIGINYLYLEDYDQSGKFFKKVKALASETKDSLRLGHVLTNLGMIEGYQNRYLEELSYYDQAARIFLAIDEFEGLGNIILNTGTVYTALEKLNKADIYYDSAIALFDSLGYYSGVQNALLSKAENSLYRGRTEEAEVIANEALSIAQLYNFFHDEVYTYELLTEIAKKNGDFSKAFNYQKAFYELNEEIFNTERTRQIDELNLKYETVEREKEIIQANAVINRKARFQMFLILLSSVIILSALIIIYIQRQKNKLNERALRAELSKLRLEIKSLIGKYEGTLEISLVELNQKLVTPLSEREFDVFKQIFSQKTNSEIAEELFVSINTVKTHLKNLYNKLGVSNRKEALEVMFRA